MAELITTNFNEKCVRWYSPSLFGAEAGSAQPYFPTLIEIYECIFGALGEVSIENGLAAQWEKYRPKVEKHFKAWKQCSKAGGKIRTALYVKKNHFDQPCSKSDEFVKYIYYVVFLFSIGDIINETLCLAATSINISTHRFCWEDMLEQSF